MNSSGENSKEIKPTIEDIEAFLKKQKRHKPYFKSRERRTAPEVPVEVKRFSQEARKALEEQGFVIYSLTGQSLSSLKKSGYKFNPHDSRLNESPDLETLCEILSGVATNKPLALEFPYFILLPSMRSEVAVKPDNFFLPESNKLTLQQQEELVGKFSEEIGSKVRGVKAIIGQVPDYAELAFKHLDANKNGLEYNRAWDLFRNEWVRTRTGMELGNVAHVGLFINEGFLVNEWFYDQGSPMIYAAPLVVPV